MYMVPSTHTHPCIHIYTHTHTYTRIHTLLHTCACTHTLVLRVLGFRVKGLVTHMRMHTHIGIKGVRV